MGDGAGMIWNVEWLNGNEQRAYPLSDSASAADATGTFALPTSFLVGLQLPVPVGLDLGTAVLPTGFFLKQVVAAPTGYTVVVGYDDGSAAPPAVASATIARATHAEYDAYVLTGAGAFENCRGAVAIGRLDEIDLQPAGAWAFTPDGGRLDVDAIRPVLRGVASLTVRNGNDVSPPLYGDIALVAGANIALAVFGQSIRIDAVPGAGMVEACDCAGTGQAGLPPPIRSINGIPPRIDGNFDFNATRCIDIAKVPYGLRFDDTCSAPCCGCPELEALTAELAYFGNEATTLRHYVAQLASQFNQFGAVVLSSRLVDTPCP